MKRIASVGIVAAVAAGAFAITGCAVEAQKEPGSQGGATTESNAPESVKAEPAVEMNLSAVAAPAITCRRPAALLRIHDNDGAAYWSYMRNPPTASPDGYTVPFPTPWITNQPNVPGMADEPDVFTYEWDQWNYVASSQDYEYLVKIINVTACPGIAIAAIPCLGGYADPTEKEWFTVPFTSTSDLAPAENFAYSTPYGSYANFNVEPNVQAEILECVTIYDGTDQVGSPLRVVESHPFVDVHDPHDPPR